MESLTDYEKQVIALLAAAVLSFEEINRIAGECEMVRCEYTGGGYRFELSHPQLPNEKIVCTKPVVFGQADDIVCRFMILIEESRLIFWCCSWGELNVTQSFRYRNVQIEAVTVRDQLDCPLLFYSFTSIGSSPDSSLEVGIKNTTDKAIYSFSFSYNGREPSGYSIGDSYQILLPPGESYTLSIGCRNRRGLCLSIDFVQFADGAVWYADPPPANVKPEGVQAGEQAAIKYLHKILKSDGAAEVIKVLLQVRSKMGLWRFSEEVIDRSGFEYGITKAVVSIQHAYQEGGLLKVEDFLMQKNN